MPCVLFAASPSELRLKGGTNAEMAPQIDYTAMVRACVVIDELKMISCILLNFHSLLKYILSGFCVCLFISLWCVVLLWEKVRDCVYFRFCVVSWNSAHSEFF